MSTKKNLPPLKFVPVSPSAKRYARVAGVELCFDLKSVLPKLPPVNKTRFVWAIATLRHEIEHWSADRLTDPELSDQIVKDCKDAIATLEKQ